MQMRPTSILVAAALALIPLWPPLGPAPHPSAVVPPASAEVASAPAPASCAPVIGTPSLRRDAARCLFAGQGMWIYEFDRAEGGDPEAIVARAKRTGISYILIRAGSSKMGFYAQPHLDAILPVAHREGLKVFVWDFPYFHDPKEDAARAARELRYRTPSGHSPDGIVPDIEEPAQGVHLSAENVDVYGRRLRELAGDEAVLLATIPRPTPPRLRGFPYATIAKHFDAMAPMVYWGYEDPAGAVARAVERLRPHGLPVIPVGQSYDMRPEGGPGQPSAAATTAFMERAVELGVPGVSFWSWQHATSWNWKAIASFSKRHTALAGIRS